MESDINFVATECDVYREVVKFQPVQVLGVKSLRVHSPFCFFSCARVLPITRGSTAMETSDWTGGLSDFMAATALGCRLRAS